MIKYTKEEKKHISKPYAIDGATPRKQAQAKYERSN